MERIITNCILPQILIIISSEDIMVSTDIEKSKYFNGGELTVDRKEKMAKPNLNSNLNSNISLFLIGEKAKNRK